MFLEDNMLSGTVPLGLSDLPNLKDLYVDENKFTGFLPRDLCNLMLNQDFFKKEDDNEERDGCTSIACPANFVSKVGLYPCEPCGEQQFSPYLGYVGDCFFRNQESILRKFFTATGGSNWKGSVEWNEHQLVCDWKGITCDPEGQVTGIVLTNMGLKGNIIPDLGFLGALRVLELADNDLTGFIPSDLRFAPLETLDVSGNKLKGTVPPLLCLLRDINANGDNGSDGIWHCDRISCPVGSYNINGFADELTACKPCKSSKFLSSKSCHLGLGPSSAASFSFIAMKGVAVIFTLMVAFAVSLAYIRKRKNTFDISHIADIDDDDNLNFFDCDSKIKDYLAHNSRRRAAKSNVHLEFPREIQESLGNKSFHSNHFIDCGASVDSEEAIASIT